MNLCNIFFLENGYAESLEAEDRSQEKLKVILDGISGFVKYDRHVDRMSRFHTKNVVRPVFSGSKDSHMQNSNELLKFVEDKETKQFVIQTIQASIDEIEKNLPDCNRLDSLELQDLLTYYKNLVKQVTHVEVDSDDEE